jgi:acylphosphatase
MIHVLISGKVQGVGFRQFIKHQANKLNILGWVKNLPDGRVEAVFTGDNSGLEKLIEICRKGPFLAEVSDIKIEDLPDQPYDTFEIIKY